MTGNVLVHCNLGKSRSSTVVAAYIMFKFQKPAVKALKYIKKRRRIIKPNPGFIIQLIKYQQSLGIGDTFNEELKSDTERHTEEEVKMDY